MGGLEGTKQGGGGDSVIGYSRPTEVLWWGDGQEWIGNPSINQNGVGESNPNKQTVYAQRGRKEKSKNSYLKVLRQGNHDEARCLHKRQPCRPRHQPEMTGDRIAPKPPKKQRGKASIHQ